MAMGVTICTMWVHRRVAGGIVDNLPDAALDIMLSLPTLFVFLVASSFIATARHDGIVIFVCSPDGRSPASVSSLFLSIREREFVEAAWRRRPRPRSSPATSCPTPSARSWSRVADRGPATSSPRRS